MSSNFNPSLSSSTKDVSSLLIQLKQNFDTIITGVQKTDLSSSADPLQYSNELALQHIQDTEKLLKVIYNALEEKNILGLPTDYGDVQSIAQNLKKSNDVLKQTLNHSTTSTSIVSKAFLTDIPPNR